jgi:hypothetical protein
MEGSQKFVSKLKMKYPILHYFTDRTFGVEIEFYGLDYYILPPDNGVIKPYNIHSKARDGRSFIELLQDYGLNLGTDKDSWHLEEDTSIVHRGGVELISPILRGVEGLIEAYRFFQMLSDIKGVEIDESCGFHVHHGVDPERYKCTHLKELVRIVSAMEDYIYLLIGGDRIDKDTCSPMDLDTELFLRVADCEDACKRNGCRLKELWYSYNNKYDPESMRCARYDLTRYHGLNLHSYWFRSTIEFRYHSAVLQKMDEAMQWIIFTQFLVELSQGHVPLIDFYINGNKWMKTIYKIYLAFGHMNRINGWPKNKSLVSRSAANP